jgi:MFS transporter, PPP family, 3-phenylpropionic acid transporter
MSVSGIRTQYVLAYAGIGCLGPFLPVYLRRQQGLTDAEIGFVLGIGGLAVLLTPVLLTRFADLGVQTRWLLAGAFTAGALALGGLSLTTGLLTAAAYYLLYSLAERPIGALQDGLYFRALHAAPPGHTLPSFSRIRVWGTVGFIVPSVLLYDLVERTGSTSVILLLAIGFGVLAAINTRRLPPAEAQPRRLSAIGEDPPGRTAAVRPPAGPVTTAALKHLLRGETRTFILGMFLVSMASAMWFGFYPLYLSEAVGVDQRAVGLIFNIGVVLEIGWMLGFNRLVRRLGIRRLMIAGAAAETLRLTLLASSPTLTVAIGTQVLHGLIVLITSVAPQIFLDERAHESFRSSIQGVYTTVVMGGGRLIGSVVAGQIAAAGFRTLFGVGASCSAAAALVFMGLRDVDAPTAAARD